ncbi:unnamed protein product [Cunninghamella echinulata]
MKLLFGVDFPVRAFYVRNTNLLLHFESLVLTANNMYACKKTTTIRIPTTAREIKKFVEKVDDVLVRKKSVLDYTKKITENIN